MSTKQRHVVGEDDIDEWARPKIKLKIIRMNIRARKYNWFILLNIVLYRSDIDICINLIGHYSTPYNFWSNLIFRGLRQIKNIIFKFSSCFPTRNSKKWRLVDSKNKKRNICTNIAFSPIMSSMCWYPTLWWITSCILYDATASVSINIRSILTWRPGIPVQGGVLVSMID